MEDERAGFLMSLHSMGIKTVVDGSTGKVSSGIHDAMCPACEMAVAWMQNQLKQNQTLDRILDYVNEVNYTYTTVFYIMRTLVLP